MYQPVPSQTYSFTVALQDDHVGIGEVFKSQSYFSDHIACQFRKEHLVFPMLQDEEF